MSEEKPEIVRTVASVSARPKAVPRINPEQFKEMAASLLENQESFEQILIHAQDAINIISVLPEGQPPFKGQIRTFNALHDIKTRALKALGIKAFGKEES